MGRPLAALVAGLAGVVAVSALPAAAAGAATSHRNPAAAQGVTPGARLTAAARTTAAARAVLARRAAAAAAAVQRPAAITGTVLGPDGRPVAGACVIADGPAGVMTQTVPASGRFVLSGLRPGSYTLEYRDCAAPTHYFTSWSGGSGWQSTAGHIPVGPGQVATAGQVTLHPTSLASQPSRAAAWRQMLASARGLRLSAAAAAKIGQIAGRVTGNGHRLRGICITVFPAAGGGGYGAVTGKDGRYTVRHIPAGRYQVIFSGLFCGSDGNWLQQLYPNTNTPFPFGGKLVKVSSGRTTSGINARLRLGGEISGRVTTRSGKPLGNLCVVANGAVAGGFEGVGLQTALNGSYHVLALFPGKYTVAFNTGCGTASIYAPQWWKHASSAGRAAQIRIKYGQRVSGISAALYLGGTISGTVRLGTSSGTPLGGICVFASNNDGTVQVAASTGTSGRYKLTGLTSGIFQLQFSAGCSTNGNYVPLLKYARATEGKTTSGFDVVLQPGAEISGTVTDTHGHPVGGICLTLSGGNSDLVAQVEGLQPQTAADGSYDLTDLAKGSYTLEFNGGCGNTGSYQPLWYDSQSSQQLAGPIVLTTGEHASLATQQLLPGVTIQGRVISSTGRKLSGVCIGVGTAGSFLVGIGVFAQIAFSTNGSYSVPNLMPGQYLVDFGCTSYADQWFNHAPTPGSADVLSAGPGDTAVINAVLQPAGSISGVVTGAGGRRLAGVCVTEFSTRDVTSVYGVIGGSGQFATNSRGAYHITGLAAGRCDVLIGGCGNSRYAQQWYRGRLTKASASPVLVRTGRDTSGINARLSLGGSISGSVDNAAGKPLPGVCVFAINAATEAQGLVLTNRTGQYTLTGLGTGEYAVYFEQCTSSQTLVIVVRNVHVTAPKARNGVNAILRPGGSVAGTVTTATPSAPASGICVEVDSANPLNGGGFAITGSNGQYVASGIAPGQYTVSFNDPSCLIGGSGLAPQLYANQPTQATATAITVTTGHTTAGIGAALLPDGGISGTVTGPAAASVTGACVTAVPLAAGNAPIVAISRAGRYSLVDLLPGRYKVEFSSGCGATGYRTQWWKAVSCAKAATVLTVAANQTITGISATLAR
jgi:hypothetical protein